MNEEPIDVIKKVRAYLISIVGAYADLANNIYTGFQEEKENKAAKYSCVLFYNYVPDVYEMGDSQELAKIYVTARFMYRVDADAVTGEKEAGDTFFQYFERRLRARAFRLYMAQTNAGITGVKCAPRYIIDAVPLAYDSVHPGLRYYVIRMELWSYISTQP